MDRLWPLTLAATTLAAALCASPALATGAPNRIWVSGHGVDAAGCGAPTLPCRSLQYAHDNAAAGGEIDVLDPAGYGAVTITKAISIVNDGVGTAGVQATSGNAITINAGAGDAVYLRGLNLDGAKAGTNGVVFNTGGALTIVGCVVRHFSQSGILVIPTSGSPNVLISDTTSSDNGLIGVLFEAFTAGVGVSAAVDHVTANNDNGGIDIMGGSVRTRVGITDSMLANNSQYGISVLSNFTETAVNIDNAHMEMNSTGLSVNSIPKVYLSRNVIDQNGTGIDNSTSNPGGIYSAGNNDVAGNINADLSGPALAPEATQ